MSILIIFLLIPTSIIIALLINYVFKIEEQEVQQVESGSTSFIRDFQNTNFLGSQKEYNINEVDVMIKNLKEIIETSNFILESSEKKNIVKALNRLSQGLFRFINGKMEHYTKNDVELIFEEIEEIFSTINYKLIVPDELDNFDQNQMIIKDFEITDETLKINKVFRTVVLGYKNINSNDVIKKAEVIIYKKMIK